MANFSIISGGQATTSNLSFWDVANVTIQDSGGIFTYAIAPGGYMRQRTAHLIAGETQYEFTFSYPRTYATTEVCLALANVNEIGVTEFVFLEGQGADPGFVTHKGSVATQGTEDTVPSYQQIAITNNSDATIYIASMAWYVSDGVAPEAGDFNRFMEKAFLYGLDADKPILGGDEEEDGN